VLLVAQVDGERRTVARIRPGAGLIPQAQVGDYQEVVLNDVTVRRAQGAAWMVRTTALADCK